MKFEVKMNLATLRVLKKLSEESEKEQERFLAFMEAFIELLSGPENERGRGWFGNDGIDCRVGRVTPA